MTGFQPVEKAQEGDRLEAYLTNRIQTSDARLPAC